MRAFPYDFITASVIVWLLLLALATGAEENLGDLRGVWQADFNHDASRIVLQMRGGTISLWDTATGQAVCRDMGKGRENAGYVLRPDHKAALIALQPQGVQLFDLATGEPVSPQFDAALLKRISPPQANFSPDGNTLLVFDSDHCAHVFDVHSGKHRIDPIPSGVKPPDETEQTREAKFTADGAWCFLMDLDGSVIRYDAKTWKAVGKPIRHPRQTYHLGFDVSADGKWLATFDSGGESGSKDLLQMWDVETAKPVGVPINAVDGITPLFLAEPGRVLVKGGRIGSGSGVYELPSGARRFSIEPHDNVYGPRVSVSPDGKWLISWGADRFFTLQDAANGKRSGGMPASCAASDVFWAPDSLHCFIVFDNSAFSLEGHYDQYVMRVRIPEMKIDGSIRVLDYIHRTVLSADGRKLMILQGRTDHERVRVFDSTTMKPQE